MDQDHELAMVGRRRVLGWLAGAAGLALLSGCGRSTSGALNTSAAGPIHPSAPPALLDVAPAGGGSTDAPTAAAGPTPAPRGTIPWAPAGPYAADGPTPPNFLGMEGSVRRDIRSSLAPGGATASGVPMTVRLTVDNYYDHGRPYDGAAIYLWQSSRDGAYSMYGPDLTDETYLRGVQPAYADGVIEFTSIFPGVEPGRWPHLHIEVYEDVTSAGDAGTILRTTQIALPTEACRAVYASPGYATSATRFGQVGLDSDPVFRNGHALQLATASGSVATGYTVALTLRV
jgi:protocatechuate 3,4-dioxygenase beta subunit